MQVNLKNVLSLEAIKAKRDCCLVIDGESLQLYMDNYQHEFIELAVELPVVVACRCSPTQKVLIV
jgi:phospholipid-translocating ATPase